MHASNINQEIEPAVMAALIAQDKADKAAASAGLPSYRELAQSVRTLNKLLGMVTDFGTATDGHGCPDEQNGALDSAAALIARIPA